MLASGGAALLLFEAEQWKALCSLLGNDVGSHYCLGTAMAAVSMCVRAHKHERVSLTVIKKRTHGESGERLRTDDVWHR